MEYRPHELQDHPKLHWPHGGRVRHWARKSPDRLVALNFAGPLLWSTSSGEKKSQPAWSFLVLPLQLICDATSCLLQVWPSTAVTPRLSGTSMPTQPASRCWTLLPTCPTKEGTPWQVSPRAAPAPTNLLVNRESVTHKVSDHFHSVNLSLAKSVDSLGIWAALLLLCVMPPVGLALNFIFENNFKPNVGMRPDSRKIGVLITDGKSQDDIVVNSQSLRDNGIELYAIGEFNPPPLTSNLWTPVLDPDVTLTLTFRCEECWWERAALHCLRSRRYPHVQCQRL